MEEDEEGDPVDPTTAASVKVRLSRAQVSGFVHHSRALVVRRPAAVPLLRAAGRPRRPSLPPDELIAVGAPRRRTRSPTHLLHGEVEVLGRMPWSSNGTYLVRGRACGDDVRRGDLQAPPGRARAVGLPVGPPPARGRGLRAVAGPRLGPRAGHRRPRGAVRPRVAAGLRRRRLRAALLHALRGRGPPPGAPGHVRVRPRRQQHRPQERPRASSPATAASAASTTA